MCQAHVGEFPPNLIVSEHGVATDMLGLKFAASLATRVYDWSVPRSPPGVETMRRVLRESMCTRI